MPLPDRDHSADEQPARPVEPPPPEAFGRGEPARQDNGRSQSRQQQPRNDNQQADQNDSKQDDGNKQTEQKQRPGGPQEQHEKKPFWRRPVLLSVMIAVALLATVAGIIWWVHLLHFISTDDAFIDGRIAHIAPRVAGKVLELKVTDNQPITADQVLIVIDPEPFKVKLHQMTAALGQAEAQLAQAQANLQVARANADEADADVIVAQANATNAERDFQRFTRIAPQARSQQQLDAATASHEATGAQVIAAQKKAASMHAMVDAAQKTMDAAQASVQAAQAQVEQAGLDLSYTNVVAGHHGRVTRRTVEVGDYVAVGQEILDVVPTDVPDDIWVTANFKETQLDHMKPGQPVSISVDAYPDDKLRGHIDSIQNGTGEVFSLLPSENATGNYVKVVQRIPVKIIIDQQPRHMLSPGMSVEPEVDVRNAR